MKNRDQWKKICTLALTIVAPVILDIVVFGYLGDKISQYNLWWVVSIIIIVTIGIFSCVWFFTNKYLSYVHFSDKRKITKSCAFKNSNCCGDMVCATISQNYIVNPDVATQDRIANEYSLYLQTHIQRKERDFFQNNGAEIWIISSNLSSEIFESDDTDTMSQVVKKNIRDGVKYYYAYFDEIDDPETIERNKKNISNALGHSNNVKFISLGKETQRLDEYILYLYGVVVYVDKNGVYEGYFSLRNHEVTENTEPIYYKMPVCIAGKYLNIMREAKQQADRKMDTSSNIRLVELTENEYSLVEGFILEQYSLLPNKDFFIVDDIKEELPKVLSDMGMMYGLFLGNELVSIQAVDLSQNVHTSLSTMIPEKFTKKQLAEIGWTMTKKEYQGRGFANMLLKQLEDRITHNYDLVVTVHPDNIESLKLYLHHGYVGVNFKEIFGLPRLFLLKVRAGIDFLDKESFYVSADAGIEDYFNKDYICRDVVVKDGKTHYLMC